MLANGFEAPTNGVNFDLEMLAGITPERLTLERFSHFAKFQWWLSSPDDLVRGEWAARTALSRAIRDTLKSLNPSVSEGQEIAYAEEVFRDHFDPATVTFALLNSIEVPVWTPYHETMRSEADTAVTIASTLLKLTTTSGRVYGPPSMNKALFMAGFSEGYAEGVSPQKARDLWAEYSATAPFLLAASWLSTSDEEMGAEETITHLPPDHRLFFDYFVQLDGEKLLRWLETTRFIQERLTQIIEEAGAASPRFLQWPSSISSRTVEVPNFSTSEVRRIRDYHVDR